MTDVAVTPAAVPVPAPAAVPEAGAPGAVQAPAAPAQPLNLTELMEAADAATRGPAPGNPATDAQPGQNAQPNPAEPPQRRKLTYQELLDADIEMVVDGKPVVESAERILRERQRHESANKRFAEAQRLRAEAEAYRESLSAALQDPALLRAELARAGYNPSEIAKALYEQEQVEATLTPEQKRLRELEMQVEQANYQEQQRQAQVEQHRIELQQQAYVRDFTKIIDDCNIPADHKSRPVLLSMLAAETERVMATEGRTYSMREGRELIASVMSPYREPAPEMAPEAFRAKITAEDVKWWLESQKAQKSAVAPQLARDPNDTLSQPRDTRGKFATPKRPDHNGRTVVRNMADVWGGKM